uniref:Uncharacterized protein n=1 Tax=Anguilla anguilla TaxID=7936 RepID=A0A0E9TLQ6_ANGAN
MSATIEEQMNRLCISTVIGNLQLIRVLCDLDL